jgi:hypothetical protein
MAVSKRKSDVAAVEEKKSGKEGKEEKFLVMLGNDCQRFMTTKSELFVAGKRYSMGAAKRKELFAYADENGVRFFYDAEVIEMQIAAAKKRGRRFAEQEEGEDGEIDTATAKGVTTLHDEEGEAVGTKDSVSI